MECLCHVVFGKVLRPRACDLIGERELLARREHRLHARGERTELRDCRDAARHDVGGTFCELRIPRREIVRRGETLADILQHGVALLQDARIAQELTVVGGTRLRELRIEIASAERRRPLDEKEILGGKKHHRQDTDEVALAQALSRVGDASPRPAGKGKGELARHIVPPKRKPDVRAVCPHANELRIARCAMGASKDGVVERLDDIRLALCIRAEKDLHPGVEREVQRLIAAIAAQRQLCDLHCYTRTTRYVSLPSIVMTSPGTSLRRRAVSGTSLRRIMPSARSALTSPPLATAPASFRN